MSYTLEVYRGNQRAEKHFGVYALYVMFYPQLVAGPIERPQNILHQFHEKKLFNFENLFYGTKQIILGLFKKIVIADRLSSYVDSVYSQVDNSNSISVFIAIVFFSFQIYCDFSGYSDIALGSARVMGFDLMKNFNNPFSSQNITEFWRKWHISLSTWFNDYLFTPLVIKFRDFGISGIALSLLITFAISGLWHGAGWTFIIYGLLHGLALVYEILTKKKRKLLKDTINPFVYQHLSTILTFLFVSFSWIFFRSENINMAVKIIKKLFSFSFTFNLTQISADLGPFNLLLSFLVLFLLKLIYNLYQSKKDTTFFVLTILLIIILGTNNAKNFIYFQF
jgi:D-alanyl-lipoteichoic acid acyltransferase DltB (MBOAT superfamily)